MPTLEAFRLAQERGYDLVEVAPMASPPVTRFLDFGQYKYELTKREKEAKRRQRSVTFKEVRLKPKIGQGDFDTKVRRAIEFLEEGDRVKVAVQFRGRELTHPEIGRTLLSKFSDQIKDHGVVERAPLLEGKSMHITVASTHKPKVTEATGRPPEAGGASAGQQPIPGTPGGAAEAGADRAPAQPAATPAAPSTPAQPAATPAAPSHAGGGSGESRGSGRAAGADTNDKRAGQDAGPRNERAGAGTGPHSDGTDPRVGADRRVRPAVPKLKIHNAARRSGSASRAVARPTA